MVWCMNMQCASVLLATCEFLIAVLVIVYTIISRSQDLDWLCDDVIAIFHTSVCMFDYFLVIRLLRF